MASSNQFTKDRIIGNLPVEGPVLKPGGGKADFIGGVIFAFAIIAFIVYIFWRLGAFAAFAGLPWAG